uniref:Uncharacterized protein n=1 Tax=Varanus komodoensis TaxID=61221 RepID=A0A8D2LPZ1_VARKO
MPPALLGRMTSKSRHEHHSGEEVILLVESYCWGHLAKGLLKSGTSTRSFRKSQGSPHHSAIASPHGGGCRAWQKSWFLSKNPFIRKVDFAHETNVCAERSPLRTRGRCGWRAVLGTLQKSRTFSFFSIWLSQKCRGTPGPGTYNVARAHNARLPSSPSFYIQGVRRPKKHETGPFSTV